MLMRTFRQFGQAYGLQPASITAAIDGAEVYSGPVNTINQPLPSLPNLELGIDNVLFSWQKPSDFSGTIEMSIQVTGSPVLLGLTDANYYMDIEQCADQYGTFYSTEINGIQVTDPFTNEKIDGISAVTDYSETLDGQWWWVLMPGSTFTATVNITASQHFVPPTPPTV